MSTPDAGWDDGGLEPPPDTLAAAEYVLGVTDSAARAATRARTAADPSFAQLVAQWETQLAPLALGIEPVEVPQRVWEQIRARLGWSAAAARRERAWHSLAFWRIATGIAAVIALATVALDLERRSPRTAVTEAQATKAVTPLVRDDGTPGWLATVDARQGTVLMVPVPGPADSQGRAAELWLIPAGQAPRSLGAVSVSRAHTVPVPRTLLAQLTVDAVLAVTLEPAVGLPHAAPSGPIIAKGMIHL